MCEVVRQSTPPGNRGVKVHNPKSPESNRCGSHHNRCRDERRSEIVIPATVVGKEMGKEMRGSESNFGASFPICSVPIVEN